MTAPPAGTLPREAVRPVSQSRPRRRRCGCPASTAIGRQGAAGGAKAVVLDLVVGQHGGLPRRILQHCTASPSSLRTYTADVPAAVVTTRGGSQTSPLMGPVRNSSAAATVRAPADRVATTVILTGRAAQRSWPRERLAGLRRSATGDEVTAGREQARNGRGRDCRGPRGGNRDEPSAQSARCAQATSRSRARLASASAFGPPWRRATAAIRPDCTEAATQHQAQASSTAERQELNEDVGDYGRLARGVEHRQSRRRVAATPRAAS